MNTKIHFVLDLGRTHKDTTKNFLDLKPVSVSVFEYKQRSCKLSKAPYNRS